MDSVENSETRLPSNVRRQQQRGCWETRALHVFAAIELLNVVVQSASSVAVESCFPGWGVLRFMRRVCGPNFQPADRMSTRASADSTG